MKRIMIYSTFASWVPLLCAVGLLLCPGHAGATNAEMFKLPTYNTFQCTICHTVSRPSTGTAELNPFGVDYLANGMVWNKTLALKNSDGDNCPNGFELGDLNGDGIADEPGSNENSNPGEQDCTISLSKQTWGIIKELFSGE